MAVGRGAEEVIVDGKPVARDKRRDDWLSELVASITRLVSSRRILALHAGIPVND
jgi:hypothetical protein